MKVNTHHTLRIWEMLLKKESAQYIQGVFLGKSLPSDRHTSGGMTGRLRKDVQKIIIPKDPYPSLE